MHACDCLLTLHETWCAVKSKGQVTHCFNNSKLDKIPLEWMLKCMPSCLWIRRLRWRQTYVSAGCSIKIYVTYWRKFEYMHMPCRVKVRKTVSNIDIYIYSIAIYISVLSNNSSSSRNISWTYEDAFLMQSDEKVSWKSLIKFSKWAWQFK
jgi:hypothetical protein